MATTGCRWHEHSVAQQPRVSPITQHFLNCGVTRIQLTHVAHMYTTQHKDNIIRSARQQSRRKSRHLLAQRRFLSFGPRHPPSVPATPSCLSPHYLMRESREQNRTPREPHRIPVLSSLEPDDTTPIRCCGVRRCCLASCLVRIIHV